MQTLTLLAILVLALIVGCAPPPTTDSKAPTGAQPITDEDKAALRANSEIFKQALIDGDEAKLGPLYTEDAVLYNPDEPAITGREAIVASYGLLPPMKEVVLELVEIEGYGDMAYVRGTARLVMPGENGEDVVLVGKYLEIHRKQPDGTWQMSRDAFNLDAPAG